MALDQLQIISAVTTILPASVLITVILAVYSVANAAHRPRQAILFPAICILFISFVLAYLPALVEDMVNHARLPVPERHWQNAKQNPKRFYVADLHCDALLWGGRDLITTQYHPFRKNHALGSVDIPRLITGKVKLQVFAAVNEVPKNMNFQNNVKPHFLQDALLPKVVLERWPMRTWFSPKQRVLHQFERLTQIEQTKPELLKVVRSKLDLEHDPAAPSRVHALMAVEGLSCLESEIDNVELFFNRGVRILGPTHFFDTEVGGSAQGMEQYGLTEFGRKVVIEMRRRSMIVDLAHASNALMTDIIDLPEHERPSVILSHTGVAALCPTSRGLADEYIDKIGQVGGLIGVALFEPALCGGDIIQAFVNCAVYIKQRLGSVDNIALGSDWDGSIRTSVSAAETHLLSSALLAIGKFSDSEVEQIMYGNAKAFFEKALPS